MADPLVTWTLSALLHFAPIDAQTKAPWADASIEAAAVRYDGIATAIADVCTGSKSERGCASLLVAIAVGESGLARDADVGPCYRQGGYRTRCDSGMAASVWQVQPQGWDAAGEPVTVAKLFADRKLAAGIALRVARSSLSRCRNLKAERRLSGLSGRCIDADGPWVARWKLWKTLSVWSPEVE